MLQVYTNTVNMLSIIPAKHQHVKCISFDKVTDLLQRFTLFYKDGVVTTVPYICSINAYLFIFTKKCFETPHTLPHIHKS